MKNSEGASVEEQEDDRTLFERFVEVVHRHASQAPFFMVCFAIVAVWLVSVPLWTDLKSWQVAIHTVASVFSLLLLVLLENSGRRAEEAAQEKLNVIAEALSDLMSSQVRQDPELEEAVVRLREAVGLEERH